MSTATQKERRPFHETIVEAIKNSVGNDVPILIELLRATKIPRGHDEIIVAVKEQWGHLGYWAQEVADIVANLSKQKEETEQKVSSPSSNDKARALMIVIEKMIARYENFHRDDNPLDEKMFKLFETAKKIDFAKTEAEFHSAIADL